MRHVLIEVDGPEITLCPISDVQVGASGVETDGLRQHIEDCLTLPNPNFFGGGDYTDSVSPSNREILEAHYAKGDLYDTPRKMMEAQGKLHAQEFLKLMNGTEGKWNFFLKGHHLNQYRIANTDGSWTIRTTDQDIAEQLGGPYCDHPGIEKGMVLVSYRFPAPSKGRKHPVLRMLALHGNGGGATFAGPFNQLEKLARGFACHIYYVAHHHKLAAARIVKLHEEPTADTSLKATDAVMVAGGSWMRGYMPDEVTYAENGLMAPLAMGSPIIHVRARKDGTFNIRTTV